jgi:hypothetical protein
MNKWSGKLLGTWFLGTRGSFWGHGPTKASFVKSNIGEKIEEQERRTFLEAMSFLCQKKNSSAKKKFLCQKKNRERIWWR